MMSKNKLVILVIFVVAIGIVALQTFFTVHQTQQAIVLQFGEPKHVIREPGLNWKIPFIQNVQYYDRRTLDLDPPPIEVLLTDKKRINVDAFARYQIINPLLYFQRVTTESTARDRLGKLINPALRSVIAKVSLKEVLSSKRAGLMELIQKEVDGDAKRLGIKVVDIRIGRTDLPEETSQAVYNRMRAEGKEMAQKIRAGADKTRTVLLANAERDAQIFRGEGEAKRNNILGKAYGKDPEFFAFFKSLEQYEKALIGNDTTMVLSPDSEFFRYFGNLHGDAKK
jgi:membrane protease subunit HflC